MAWLWASHEEYEKFVHPIMFKDYKNFDHVMSYTWATMEDILCNASRLLDKYKLDIFNLLQHSKDVSFKNKRLMISLKDMVTVLIESGERLLFFHKRLAIDSSSNSFLQDKNMIEHWDRYAQSDRIFDEIEQIRLVVDDLLMGYHTMAADDGTFLISPMTLPDDTMSDFKLAQNLFSVGFDDVGVLIACRGLETALRTVAEKKCVEIEVKNKRVPAHEADMHNVIEALYRIRWRATKRRVISLETRNLLHYLRSIRNSSAHSHQGRTDIIIKPRETAIIVAGTAREIWKVASRPRARVDAKVLEKCW